MGNIFYFAKVFNGLNTAFTVFMILACIISLVLIAGWFIEASGLDEDDEDEAKVKRVWHKSMITALIIFFVSIFGNIFVPDDKTYLLMVGGNAVEKAIEKNPEVEEIPKNTLILPLAIPLQFSNNERFSVGYRIQIFFSVPCPLNPVS